MKSIFLAAAAMIATPAIAQMQPETPAGQTAPDTMTQGTGTMGTTTAEPTTSTPTTGGTTGTTTGSMGSTGGMAPSTGSAMAGDADAADPAGGYMPSTPPMQGTPAAGATVRFQQAPDPNTAFPPPAPKQNYPICKKGQYDGCMQRGGK